MSISKEKPKRSDISTNIKNRPHGSNDSKKRPSPNFEREESNDVEMKNQYVLKNLFYSLKKTKVFEQTIYKDCALNDLKLISEYQK